MGFYGKVNNNSAVQFVIDKIYSSRVEMEQALKDGDNVFIGRYVLIEYNHALTQLFKTTINKEIRFYFSRLLNEDSRAKFLSNDKELMKEEYYKKNYVKENQIIYILDENSQTEYYKCIGGDNNGYAIFEKQAENYSPAKENIYFDNYLKDTLAYPDSRRGYDSTVWQKIYVDESEEYVMIAELNSVVPTFDLTVDAPQLLDGKNEKIEAPHFDADSTNVYYKLHVQPNWGFRVKPSENGDIPGKNIYYNRAGFNPEIQSRIEIGKNDDVIEITTAQSGALYNTHNKLNPNEVKPADDIQELSIILPSIGNTISDIWDIVYGADKKRDTIISWDKADGKRLVKQNETGYLFATEDVATLAGCINSTHDLMGRIIENEPEIDVKDALTNKIYYGSFGKDKNYKSFYIKDLKYDYPESNEQSTPEEIKNMKKFEAGKYYYVSDKNYYLEENEYSFGNQYYNLEGIVEVTLLDEYKPNQYYYEDIDKNYKLDLNTSPDENKVYYTIIEEKMTSITSPYISGINNNPVLFFNPIDPYEENGIQKGYVYFYEDQYRPVNKDSILDNSLNYYWAEGFGAERKPSADYPNDPSKDYWTYNIEKADLKYPIKFIPFDETASYYFKTEENNYIKLISKENINNTIVYKQFNEESKIKIEHLFYEPNLYYYSINDKDYIFAIEPNKLSGVKYYKLDPATSIDATFYEPNKYWYYLEGELILATEDQMDETKDYFKYSPLCVKSDSAGIFKTGALWNPHVTKPETVVLGTKKESWQWKELKGFARNLNTIHGLIVKINNILKTDDLTTRDTNTIQGCINQINDIINTIDVLKPNHFIAVNEYGRMTSMAAETDEWIDIKVNNENNDKVIITHTGPVTSNESKKDDLTPKFGDTFTIEDWYFDDKGHRSNKTIHTVKIPQGSLTDDTKTGSDLITQLSFNKPTGTLTSTRENLSSIKLAGYTKDTSSTDVDEGDTLGQALSKLQNQIIEEETARINAISNAEDGLNKAIEKEVADRNAAIKVETDARIAAINKEIIDRQAAINALDATITTESAEMITSITQTDGLVSADKKKVGELTLTGWTLGENVANSESIADTDTVNNAFAKAQRQINANKAALTVLNGNSSTPGSVAYQIAEMVVKADEGGIDKLEEIAAWIVNDTTGAAKMNSDIKANADAIDALELLVGNTAVATQIANAINNAVLIDGANKYALAADLVNLSTTVGNINGRVENLELAVSAEKIAQWDAAEVNVQSDWAETDENSDSYIKNKPTLDFVPMETYNALLERIAALEARIEALENPGTEEPIPNPENPEEPVE